MRSLQGRRLRGGGCSAVRQGCRTLRRGCRVRAGSRSVGGRPRKGERNAKKTKILRGLYPPDGQRVSFRAIRRRIFFICYCRWRLRPDRSFRPVADGEPVEHEQPCAVVGERRAVPTHHVDNPGVAAFRYEQSAAEVIGADVEGQQVFAAGVVDERLDPVSEAVENRLVFRVIELDVVCLHPGDGFEDIGEQLRALVRPVRQVQPVADDDRAVLKAALDDASGAIAREHGVVVAAADELVDNVVVTAAKVDAVVSGRDGDIDGVNPAARSAYGVGAGPHLAQSAGHGAAVAGVNNPQAADTRVLFQGDLRRVEVGPRGVEAIIREDHGAEAQTALVARRDARGAAQLDACRDGHRRV